jgi:hypothetical protein
MGKNLPTQSRERNLKEKENILEVSPKGTKEKGTPEKLKTKNYSETGKRVRKSPMVLAQVKRTEKDNAKEANKENQNNLKDETQRSNEDKTKTEDSISDSVEKKIEGNEKLDIRKQLNPTQEINANQEPSDPNILTFGKACRKETENSKCTTPSTLTENSVCVDTQPENKQPPTSSETSKNHSGDLEPNFSSNTALKKVQSPIFYGFQPSSKSYQSVDSASHSRSLATKKLLEVFPKFSTYLSPFISKMPQIHSKMALSLRKHPKNPSHFKVFVLLDFRRDST